MKDISNHCIS